MNMLRQAAVMALEALEYGQHTLKQVSENQWESLGQLAMDALLAALAEPVQEQPVCDECGKSKCDGWALYCVKCVEPMFAPPQRKPLTEEEIKACEKQAMVNGALPFEQRVFFARAIERAHGIT